MILIFSKFISSTRINLFTHRISLALLFAGLCHFLQGQGFVQWTGDNSKALMKVHLWIILSCIWITHRFIYQLFKAMYLMKWSRLFKLSLTFVLLSDVMYMTTKASACYRMLSIISTNTMKYSEWLVFIPMALIFLNPIPLPTTCVSFKHLVLQMASAHQSQNWNIL